MSTREQVVMALVAVADAAAATLTRARVVNRPEKPVDLEQGETIFVVPEAEAVELLQTIGRCPPYYITDSVGIEVVHANTASRLTAGHNAALAALEVALRHDQTLGGIVKGLDWSTDGAEIEAPEGASPERVSEVVVVAEYESATRLVV